ASLGTDRLPPSSHASSAASSPPMRRRNHCSRPKGIPKMKLQGFRHSSPKTLQSQNRLQPRKRLLVSRLALVHGQLSIEPHRVPRVAHGWRDGFRCAQPILLGSLRTFRLCELVTPVLAAADE